VTEKTEKDGFDTLGEFLKQVREKKNLSLAEVSQTLCIRKVYIKAIEESDVNELPPIPYGVGFVRSYARFLGLNVERIVQLYKEENAPDDKEIQVFEPQSDITYPTKKYIIAGVVAAFVVYLIFALIGGIKQSKEDAEISPEDMIVVQKETPSDADTITNKEYGNKTESASTTEEKPIDLTVNQKQEALADKILIRADVFKQESPKIISPRKNSRVVVRFKGESWFEVKDASKVYISKIVNEGFEYEIPNKPGMILSVGRYYNTDVYIDGKLTKVATKRRQTNIELDKFLNKASH